MVRIIESLVTLILMLGVIKISNAIIENAFKKVSDVAGLSNNMAPLVKNIAKIVIVLAALMIILSVWQISITPLLASAGIAGAGVALAARDTIANFLGGISIFADKPFKIGDYIVLEGGERGEVTAIGIRSTKVKTLDDIMITIPNSVIINSRIINESSPTTSLRLRIPVSAAYGSDIDSVENALVEIAMENENIVKDPFPQAVMTGFGEHGLNFELLCRIEGPELRPVVVDAITKRVYKKFGELGIGMPFSPTEVHKGFY